MDFRADRLPGAHWLGSRSASAQEGQERPENPGCRPNPLPENFWEELFQSYPDLLIVAEAAPGWAIHSANQAFSKTSGIANSEIAGRSLIDLFDEEHHSGLAESLAKVAATQEPVRLNLRLRSLQGATTSFSWTIGLSSKRRHLYLSGRNIPSVPQTRPTSQNDSKISRAAQLQVENAKLSQALAQTKTVEAHLRESNAELESFSYSVSHDLRAPVRAMHAFAEALLDDCRSQLGESGKDFATRIVSNAERMEALIEDLLVYSRVQHTHCELRPVNLETVLREALQQLDNTSPGAGARILIERPLQSVLGHPAILLQILINLLSNALKFVPEGVAPRVRVETEQRGATIRLWVHDNGIGIAPEHHDAIFRGFERLHGIERYPGTGLGLAIVRKGAERMGGRAGLESSSGHGSRFWVDLMADPGPGTPK